MVSGISKRMRLSFKCFIVAIKRLKTPLSFFSLPRTVILSSNSAIKMTAIIPTARYMLIKVIILSSTVSVLLVSFAEVFATSSRQSYAPQSEKSIWELFRLSTRETHFYKAPVNIGLKYRTSRFKSYYESHNTENTR